MITSINLTLAYTRHGKTSTILDDLSFAIPKGRITAFIGTSGAGKTSLLRCCAALTTSYDGDVLINGTEVRALSDRERVHQVGFVFQHFNLFPHKTVEQNCMMPLVYEGVTEDEARERADTALTRVGMDAFADRYPSQLSGGQKQRVAIARALVLQPKVLLFDEPTSALDPHSTNVLIEVVKQLRDEEVTIALASHDMSFVHATLDRAYFMEQGKIIEAFDAQDGEIAASPKLCSFLSCR